MLTQMADDRQLTQRSGCTDLCLRDNKIRVKTIYKIEPLYRNFSDVLIIFYIIKMPLKKGKLSLIFSARLRLAKICQIEI